jgi:hypothetical protein
MIWAWAILLLRITAMVMVVGTAVAVAVAGQCFLHASEGKAREVRWDVHARCLCCVEHPNCMGFTRGLDSTQTEGHGQVSQQGRVESSQVKHPTRKQTSKRRRSIG